jgi:hypothetical protein
MRRDCPSSVPLVPSSAIRYWMTCSGLRCMALQISIRFTNTVFFVPSRQGLTLVHFPAQRQRFVWDRGCI